MTAQNLFYRLYTSLYQRAASAAEGGGGVVRQARHPRSDWRELPDHLHRMAARLAGGQEERSGEWVALLLEDMNKQMNR